MWVLWRCAHGVTLSTWVLWHCASDCCDCVHDCCDLVWLLWCCAWVLWSCVWLLWCAWVLWSCVTAVTLCVSAVILCVWLLWHCIREYCDTVHVVWPRLRITLILLQHQSVRTGSCCSLGLLTRAEAKDGQKHSLTSTNISSTVLERWLSS